MGANCCTPSKANQGTTEVPPFKTEDRRQTLESQQTGTGIDSRIPSENNDKGFTYSESQQQKFPEAKFYPPNEESKFSAVEAVAAKVLNEIANSNVSEDSGREASVSDMVTKKISEDLEKTYENDQKGEEKVEMIQAIVDKIKEDLQKDEVDDVRAKSMIVDEI